MKQFRNTPFHCLAIICGLMITAQAPAAESKSTAVDAQFAKMDVNKDGRVAADEHAAGAKQMFDTMDADGNGKVTASEMHAAHERVSGKKPDNSDMSAAEKIKVVDSNDDGVLTSAEHALGSRTMFQKMDSNKDSSLSQEEFVAGHAQMMKKPAP